MSISVTCTHCRRAFRVKDHYEGKNGHCPFCNGLVCVPVSTPEIAEGDFVQQDDANLAFAGTSTDSLMMQVPLISCPSCSKDILESSPTCFYCGAIVPVTGASLPQRRAEE